MNKDRKHRAGNNSLPPEMKQARMAMEPHLDKLETEAGRISMVLISSLAAFVQFGVETPETLALVIKLASAKSGIPEEALEAHARLTALVLQDAQ